MKLTLFPVCFSKRSAMGCCRECPPPSTRTLSVWPRAAAVPEVEAAAPVDVPVVEVAATRGQPYQWAVGRLGRLDGRGSRCHCAAAAPDTIIASMASKLIVDHSLRFMFLSFGSLDV